MPEQITLERNGIVKTLDIYKLVKGKKKGTEYLAPTVDFSTPEAWANEIAWGELKNVANCWQTFLKRVFQDIYFASIDSATGVANIAKFLEEAKDFSAAGMKLAEIVDKLEEAQAELGRLVDAMEEPENVDANGAMTDEFKAKLKDCKTYVTALKAMKEDRSRKRTKPEDEEASEPSVRVQ